MRPAIVLANLEQSAMPFDDGARYREPKSSAHARRLGCKKRLKNAPSQRHRCPCTPKEVPWGAALVVAGKLYRPYLEQALD
jgi:hypothetical protein